MIDFFTGRVACAYNTCIKGYINGSTKAFTYEFNGHTYYVFSLNVSGGSERGTITEIKDLINLEMPQLNEALSTNTASTQVIDRSCRVFVVKHNRHNT